jgi:uncharacterized membrane protein
MHDGGTTPNFHAFLGEPAGLRSVSQIIAGALHGQAPATIQLGLLLLIATPVARVLFACIEFALERDWLYVGIGAIVLAVLALGLSGHRL